MKLILILTFLILLNSCGFKRISQNNNLFYLQKITIEGDKKISQILRNNILVVSNKKSVDKYELKLKIKRERRDKIKNISGKITRYTLVLNTNLSFKNIKNQKTITKSFSQNTDYEVEDIHSNTVRNEKKASNMLTEALSDKIINFINFSIKNK
tara:strand:- start:320 stop:781 length:462 start_codon:yes stop_codon:yes gene_type:complete